MPAKPARIQLPETLRQLMLEHATSQSQKEVCGLIGASGDQFTSYYPVRNIAEDPGRVFLMDPVEQIEAMRQMRNSGEEIAGIFHSHPFSPAQPSATDRNLASYPYVSYLILSLSGSQPVFNAFFFDGKDFTQIPVQILDK